MSEHRKRLPRPSANTVTVRDVARAARVSMATVSRVLNGNTSVDRNLSKRVATAARQLGYTPHAAARALASQRSRTIGAVMPTLENINFAVGVAALQRRIAEAGYTLLLGSSNYDLEEELRQVKALAAHGVAGMMLVGARHAPGLYELLQAKRIPFVNTWVLDSRHPCVGFDNREIGRALANYLLDLGHVEFGVIAQITGHSDRAAGRVIGIREALAARGIAPAVIGSTLTTSVVMFPFLYLQGNARAAFCICIRPMRPRLRAWLIPRSSRSIKTPRASTSASPMIWAMKAWPIRMPRATDLPGCSAITRP